MSESGSRSKLATAVVLLGAVLAGCTAVATAPPSAGGPSLASPLVRPDQTAGALATPPEPMATAATPAAPHGRLIALADGPDGVRGLWNLERGSSWVPIGDAPTATALGRTSSGLALVTDDGVEFRNTSAPSKVARAAALIWAGRRPTAPVVAIDYSASGKAAVVTADEASLGYAVAGPNGALAPLTQAPSQSFSPLVAWLDEARLLVLATDNQQVSRLAIVDTTSRTMKPAGALAGVRVFALSGDRKTVAAATETALYVGPLTGFSGTSGPSPVVELAEAEIVWALALDRDGSTLFMLAGRVGVDGSVDGVREVSYARRGPDWQKVLDAAVPFGRAVAQVYLDS